MVALSPLAAVLIVAWFSRTTGITTDDNASAADPFTAEAPENNATNNAPGGFYRPGDLPFDDPALAKHVLGVNPEQIHLTYWSPSQMLVTWLTGDAFKGPQVPVVNAQSVASVVEYGAEPGNYTFTTEQTADNLVYTQTYPNESFWDVSYASPIIHYVVLSDLQPGQQYFYRVGDPNLLAMSDEISFRMPANELPLRISATADVSTSFRTVSNIEYLASLDPLPDLHLIIGDLVYADIYQANGTINPGELRIKNYTGGPFDRSAQDRWDMMGRIWQPYTSQVPVMTTPGNHETEPQGSAPNKLIHASYNALYPMPQDPTRLQTQAHQGYCNPNDSGLGVNTPGLNVTRFNGTNGYCTYQLAYELRSKSNQQSNSWYAVDLASTRLYSLAQWVDWEESSEQYQWFSRDLAALDRDEFPWVIVQMHGTIYQTFTSAFKDMECFRLLYEPLFLEHGVDLVLSGHTHGYERSKPIVDWKVNTCGPVYIMVGNGGQSSVPGFIDTSPPAYCNDTNMVTANQETYLPNAQLCLTLQNGSYCPDRQPEWSAYRSQCFGTSLLTIENATHALWQMHCQEDPQGEFQDSVWLIHQERQGCTVEDFPLEPAVIVPSGGRVATPSS